MHAECGTVLGHGHYTAGPGLDVLGRLREGEAVLVRSRVSFDVDERALTLCKQTTPGGPMPNWTSISGSYLTWATFMGPRLVQRVDLKILGSRELKWRTNPGP
jgi:hypothetical protein